MVDEWTRSAFLAGLGTTVFAVLALRFPLGWVTLVLLIGAAAFTATLFQHPNSCNYRRFISAGTGVLAMIAAMLEVDIALLPLSDFAFWSLDTSVGWLISLVLALTATTIIAADVIVVFFRSGVNIGERLKLVEHEHYRLPNLLNKLSRFDYGLDYFIQHPFQFKARYLELLIEDHRDYQMKGLQSQSPFVLDLEKIFVPLRVSAQSSHKISSNMLQTGKTDKTHDIWDYLAADPQILNRCMAILGPPGSGKTTLLGHLTLVYAKKAQHEYHRQAPADLIPIFLSLRDHREELAELEPPNLADLLGQQERIQRIQPPQYWFKNRLQKGRCLVMLDGLDEVADDKERRAVARWVSQQIDHYPRSRFILTSRPFGYRSAKIRGIGTILEVRPFSLHQVNQFIESWYLQHEILRRLGRNDAGVQQRAHDKAEDLRSRIMDYKPLRDMAINPLLLTMIAAVHDNRGVLPGRRVELYEEICNVLLARRQEAKKITDEQLSVMNKRRMLQLLALALMQAKTRSFVSQDVKLFIAQRLAAMGWEGSTGDFLERAEKQSGLLIQREADVFEFTHLSFQEYLAAVEIKEERHQRLLLKYLDNPWWEEVIRLYAVQAGDASELIRAILNKPTVNSLRLAYECVEEGAEVQPKIRKALLDKIERGLESDDAEVAEIAAQVKLSLRINKHLQPLDDHLLIDMSLVSCAEYQLFVDEMREQGRNRWPPHWADHHFNEGQSNIVVTGIRFEDAEAFCHWLSSHYAEMGQIYRLPSKAEAAMKPISNDNVGYWCSEGELTPVSINHSILEHQKLWGASFKDFLYSKYSTWDIVEDLAKSFLLLFDRARDFTHWMITFLDQIANSEIDYNHARISDNALYKDVKFAGNELRALAERIHRFYNRVRGFIRSCRDEEGNRIAFAGEFLHELIKEQKSTAKLIDKLDELFLRIVNNNNTLNQKLKKLKARARGIDYMLNLSHELLLIILEELDRAASTSHRKPVAVSDGVDLDAVFETYFAWLHQKAENKSRVFPDYHQILNDIFMNTENCSFNDIVDGLQAMVDSRCLRRERALSRELILLVIAACNVSERSNILGGRFFARLSDHLSNDELKEQAFAIYTYLNLLDRRYKRRLPVWEGLRIVREYRM